MFKDEFFAAYNDEHPAGKTDFNRGHMKGLMAFDDISGFWLIHSVPKFPLTLNGTTYSYPNSGRVYGQSFLCITFSSASLDDIGIQLIFGQPSFYDKFIPPSFEQLYPNLAKALAKKSRTKGSRKSKSPTSSMKKLQSLKGQSFISFYKNNKFGHDLYDNFVAPELDSSFYVETWNHCSSPDCNLPSDCSHSNKVFNVRSLNVDKFSFNTTNDHSKWAVSDSKSDASWICIGDINRQESQGRRGGGTTCFQNRAIARLYQSSIETFECCDGRNDQCDHKFSSNNPTSADSSSTDFPTNS